jgi:hypothetical protein
MPFKQTSQQGGTGGGQFSDDLTQVRRLIRVNIRHGSRVDGIQAIWQTCEGTQQGNWHGGQGGQLSGFDLGPDEFIVLVEGRSGSRVDSLTFTTNKGNSFGPYGGTGGKDFKVSNIQLGGFYGRSASELDAIGFWTQC